jgi:RNA polymerase sigma-70 factor (ECF subfamily)
MCSSSDVTQQLHHWTTGHTAALNHLMPLVYGELRRLAERYLRRERPGHTLQPTALVHEAYERLVGQHLPLWQNRAHFFGVAAQLMRQTLIDHARRHQAAKRCGQQVPLDEVVVRAPARSTALLALDDAVTALATLDPRKGRIVELHFFGGLTVEETAQTLGVSVATIGRELRFAKAWLSRELQRTSAT